MIRGIGVLLRRNTGLALAVAGVLGVFGCLHPASAREPRHAALILDANTGQVLHNEDGDELRHPASLTKIMTLFLAFETIEAGRMSMSDRIEISQEAASVAPSKLDLDPGEQISVQDAIKAIITKSANDIAVAMAEKIGGTQANFVRLMNAKARELGMSKTHFENASGLPNDDQVTTARDMVTLGMRLQDEFPQYYPLFAMREFRYNGTTLRNHNTMLGTFAGIDGIKTGYTRNSGFNLVSSVHRGGKHLIGAVFGGASAATRNGEMRILLTRAMTLASTAKTRKPMLLVKLRVAPKLAERPKPKPAAPAAVVAQVQPPKPIEAANDNVSPAKRPRASAPQAEPAVAQVAVSGTGVPTPAAETAAPPVEIFKVKHVMVAPRKSVAEAPNTDETTDITPEPAGDAKAAQSPGGTVASQDAARSGDVASSPRAAGGEMTIASLVAADARLGRETVVAKSADLDPRASLDGNRIAMLDTSDAVLPVRVAASDAPAPATPAVAVQSAPANSSKTVALADPTAVTAAPASQRTRRYAAPGTIIPGQQPSTLQAQAAALAPAASRRQYTASLQPSAVPGNGAEASPTRFEIQIGAFSSIEEAQRKLSDVQARAGTLLASYPSVTHPVQKGGRQIFRARFRGFDAQTASATCSELRRKTIDCFVMTEQ